MVVVRKDGVAKRGGYFFHIRKTGNKYVFSTFDRSSVLAYESGSECARFINHVAGLAYDPQMWEVAQKVNLRSDEDTV